MALGIALSMPLLLMAPSFACTYNPVWNRPATLTPVATGAPFEIVGTGFMANETVFFTLNPGALPVGEELAKVDGTVATSLVLPDVPTGSYVLWAKQLSQTNPAPRQIDVVRTEPAGGGNGDGGGDGGVPPGPTTTVAPATIPPPPPPGIPAATVVRNTPSAGVRPGAAPAAGADRGAQSLPAVVASGAPAAIDGREAEPVAAPVAPASPRVTPLPPPPDGLWSAVDGSAAPTVLDPPTRPEGGTDPIGLGLVGLGGALLAGAAWAIGRRRPALAAARKR